MIDFTNYISTRKAETKVAQMGQISYYKLTPEQKKVADDALGKRFGKIYSPVDAALATFFCFGTAAIAVAALIGLEDSLRARIMGVGGLLAGASVYAYYKYKWRKYFTASEEISAVILKSAKINITPNH
ncbi:MAG: hypothetical protein Q7J57_07965 [Gemmobacter sp.]|nr:hypothetical protein [Gemmobacter sp.]